MDIKDFGHVQSWVLQYDITYNYYHEGDAKKREQNRVTTSHMNSGKPFPSQ